MENKFGKRLMELRQEKGISQKQLAEVLGVFQQSINRWENGKIKPGMDNIIALAEYFNVTVELAK